MESHTSKTKPPKVSMTTIRGLTYLMFMMFAMTTDSVGLIIPVLMKAFHLSQSAASAFQYSTMSGIGIAGLCLGMLADRFGRKNSILLGLSLFALNAFLFVIGNRFEAFLVLLFVSGVSIGIFKTGALALISDISSSSQSHTRTMNLVETFFAIGAIIGPLIVTELIRRGLSWKFLYVIAGILCVGLILTALLVRYPANRKADEAPINPLATLSMLGNGWALYFSAQIMLYVGAEVAIFVWMPTFLARHPSNLGQSAHMLEVLMPVLGSAKGMAILFATYATSIFFILRAVGRFFGSFLLSIMPWTWVLVVCSGAILVCFLGAVLLGEDAAIYLLPLSGLFMSVIYPTINSKGMSCFPKAQHGAVGGVILFFTCVSAALVPWLMGQISDHFAGQARYGFYFATLLTALLFAMIVFNALRDPSRARLKALDMSEYDMP